MFQEYTTKLTSKILLANNIYQFGFELIEPELLEFIPGQYLLLCIGDKVRQYSIATPNSSKKYFEIVVEIFPGGVASEYLFKSRLNDQILFKGPAGVFNLKDNPGVTKRIFLATGTGIAPIKSMILSTVDQFEMQYHLFWGARYKKDVYYADLFFDLTRKYQNFKYNVCLSRENDQQSNQSYFIFDRIDHCLKEMILSDQKSVVQFYLCGSAKTVLLLNQLLLENGVDKNQIIFERFT